MSGFEEFLIEFEKYLEKKFWNFKKYGSYCNAVGHYFKSSLYI